MATPGIESVSGRYVDLREFVRQMDKAGELQHIKAPVNWDSELGEISRAVFKRKGPAMLFENVKDSNIPLLCGALATNKRFGLMIGCSEDIREQMDYLTKVMGARILPRMVDRAACQENVLKGSEVDLSMFPVPKWHPKDGGR